MKALTALVALFLLIGGYLYFTGSKASAPVDESMEVSSTDMVATTTESTEGGMSATSTDESMATSSMTSVQTFNVTGKNFEFSVKEMKVKKGDTVKINFESTDGFHDWKIDEFSAATQQVRPGTLTSTEFIADKVGTFEYYCSVGSHRANGMVGRFVVEE